MATITGLTMTIDRNSTSTGETCTINYSYTLTCSGQEEAVGIVSVTLSCELWGKDARVLGFLDADDKLGSPPFDTHTTRCDDTMPVSRSFPVPCSTLNEDSYGADEIYLVLKAMSASPAASMPSLASIQSAVVTSRF